MIHISFRLIRGGATCAAPLHKGRFGASRGRPPEGGLKSLREKGLKDLEEVPGRSLRSERVSPERGIGGLKPFARPRSLDSLSAAKRKLLAKRIRGER